MPHLNSSISRALVLPYVSSEKRLCRQVVAESSLKKTKPALIQSRMAHLWDGLWCAGASAAPNFLIYDVPSPINVCSKCRASNDNENQQKQKKKKEKEEKKNILLEKNC